MPDLADDLGRGQVAIEALRPRRTERAIERATDLRRNAQGATRRLGNVHSLDALPGTAGKQPFDRAIRGFVLTVHSRQRDCRPLGKLDAK